MPRGALSRVGVGAPVSDPRLGLPTGARGATEGLLRGFSRVGVGEYVVFPIGVRGASEGFCSAVCWQVASAAYAAASTEAASVEAGIMLFI